MFAVSRKPISSTSTTTSVSSSSANAPQQKFVTKSEMKPREKEILASGPSQKANQETPGKKLFENVKDGASPGSQQSTMPSNKRIKVRLSIIKDIPYSQKFPYCAPNDSEKKLKKSKEMKLKNRKTRREGNFNCGRWQPEEHERFIEAIMKYGNEWKSVQKHVGTRSSTQARSHAQKFFVKMKKANLLDLNIDFSKNSIKTLHEVAHSMNAEEYFNAIKALNCVAFERKTLNKRRSRKEDSHHTLNTLNNDSSALFTEAPSALHLNNDDIFSLNTNENSLFPNKTNDCSFTFNTLTTNKLQQEPEQKQSKKSKDKKNINTIIINNNFNTFNLNFNNDSNQRSDNFMLRKRNRLSSFEGLLNLNLFPELGRDCGGLFSNFNLKRGFDEKEYIDNFNCTFKSNTNNDFEIDKELEEMIMLSQSEELNDYHHQKQKRRNSKAKEEDFFEDIMLDFYIETGSKI